MSNLESRVDTAFTKMSLRSPFVAAVMTKVKREVTTDRVPTASTNGSTIWFNEQWCSALTDEELYGLSLHEAYHVIFMHSWRRMGRDHQLWNVANDALINELIKAERRALPKGGVNTGGVNLPWVTTDMTSEDVYERLRQEMQQPPQGGKGGKGKGKGKGDGQPDFGAGGFDGTGDLEDAVDQATQMDMEAVIQAAAQMAKAAGQGGALVDLVLKASGPPVVRWQDVLRNLMTEKACADYTYMRPSRRHIANGLYLPSLHSEGLGGLLLGFDTSGSMMDQATLDAIATEINGIVDDTSPAFVEVVFCDYTVTKVQRFERGDNVELLPKGGGGTRFKPVFDHAAETGDVYCGMVYFTDMEGNLDECPDPGFPVIWASTNKHHAQPPVGTVTSIIL